MITLWKGVVEGWENIFFHSKINVAQAVDAMHNCTLKCSSWASYQLHACITFTIFSTEIKAKGRWKKHVWLHITKGEKNVVKGFGKSFPIIIMKKFLFGEQKRYHWISIGLLLRTRFDKLNFFSLSFTQRAVKWKHRGERLREWCVRNHHLNLDVRERLGSQSVEMMGIFTWLHIIKPYS